MNSEERELIDLLCLRIANEHDPAVVDELIKELYALLQRTNPKRQDEQETRRMTNGALLIDRQSKKRSLRAGSEQWERS